MQKVLISSVTIDSDRLAYYDVAIIRPLYMCWRPSEMLLCFLFLFFRPLDDRWNILCVTTCYFYKL